MIPCVCNGSLFIMCGLKNFRKARRDCSWVIVTLSISYFRLSFVTSFEQCFRMHFLKGRRKDKVCCDLVRTGTRGRCFAEFTEPSLSFSRKAYVGRHG